MKIFTVCQSGLGTSFMVQMNIQQILEEVGVDTDNFQIEMCIRDRYQSKLAIKIRFQAQSLSNPIKDKRSLLNL